MRPRTAVLALFILLSAATGLRYSLVWSRIIPRENDDLLLATSIGIHYSHEGRMKFLSISNPDEVKAILATMSFETNHHSRYRRWSSSTSPNWNQVFFNMADGSQVETTFVHATQLNRKDGNSAVLLLNRRFYEKINAILSSVEGKKVDILQK
jgi:hypothetical protein